MSPTADKSRLQTTTVRLPKNLYDEARSLVEGGQTESRSFNDLMVASLNDKLKQVRRACIDAEFAGMREDAAYQRESQTLAEQFETNDRETLRLTRRAKR